MNETKIGVVTRFGSRGFGFLVEHATRQTYFVHVNDVIGHLVLQTGDRVTFEAAPSAIPGKAPSAIQVRLVSSPERLDRSDCQRVLPAPPGPEPAIPSVSRQALAAQPSSVGGGR